MRHIREKDILSQTLGKRPQIHICLTEDYTENEVHEAIRRLEKNKSHGEVGIPGDCIATSLTAIRNKIIPGDPLPPEWPKGAMVYIYKNKGGVHECENCRPICLTQIAYKIRPKLITGKLAKTPHLTTGTTQSGPNKDSQP